MKIEQRFTGTGWLGVAFLFVGPVVGGYGYSDYLNAMAPSIFGTGQVYSDPLAAMTVMAFGSLISLASFPMMIIGREFETTVNSEPLTKHTEPSL